MKCSLLDEKTKHGGRGRIVSCLVGMIGGGWGVFCAFLYGFTFRYDLSVVRWDVSFLFE